MKNTYYWKMLTLCLSALPIMLNAENFSNYKQSQGQQFNSKKLTFAQYKSEQKKAFATYQKTYLEAFAQYKSHIQKHWNKPETSGQKKWVVYQKNYRQKTVVDFEKSTITISQKINNKADFNKKRLQLEKELSKLQTLDYQQAYQLDPVARKIEHTLLKFDQKTYKTAQASRASIPILSAVPDLNLAKIKRRDGQISIHYHLKKQDVEKRIQAFLPKVIEQGKKHRIDPALILAFIKNESAFNPLAKSHVPAFGLMQIVPRSAGRDVSKFLYGRSMLLSPKFLYNPNHNIEVGTAYIHILYYRYLKSIHNKQSKLYCTIAAYNTGAGNVAKSFGGGYNINRASRRINSQPSSSVYQRLMNFLPYTETKSYLRRVLNSYREYQQLF